MPGSELGLAPLWAFLDSGTKNVVEMAAFRRSEPPLLAYPRTLPKAQVLVEQADLMEDVTGVYWVPNAISPREASAQWAARKQRTRADDVVMRRCIYIDVDAQRESGSNSSEEEKLAAHNVATAIYDFLADLIPAAAMARGDSGNGFFLLIALRPTPSTPRLTENIQALLRFLDGRFSTDGAKVDLTVFDASRLTPVPGSLKRKAEGSRDRPQRRVTLAIPEKPEKLTMGSLFDEDAGALAAFLRGVDGTKAASNRRRGGKPKKMSEFAALMSNLDAWKVCAALGLSPHGNGRCSCPSCRADDAEMKPDGLRCYHDSCAANRAAGALATYREWPEVVRIARQCSRVQAWEWLLKHERSFKPSEGDAGDAGDANSGVEEELPRVLISHEEGKVIDVTISLLAQSELVFVQTGRLVEIERIEGRARPLNAHRLRELLSMLAQFWSLKTSPPRRVSPPDWLVKMVLSRPFWSGVPPLTGIIFHPVLLDDGTVVDEPGYVAPIASYVVLNREYPKVPRSPSRDDALAALSRLVEPLCDFPFFRRSDRSGALGLIFTLTLRQTRLKLAPMFLIDSSVQAAGKTILAQLAGAIVLGDVPPASSLTGNAEELRKRVTAELSDGELLVLLDNVSRRLGGDALDVILTGSRWKDRKLGEGTTLRLASKAVFVATGINLQLEPDMVRRCVQVRLEPNTANPEIRGVDKYPELLDHVLSVAPGLLVDVLTIVRAYELAGCPQMNLFRWATYGAFTKWVRSPLVWLGEADPIEHVAEWNAQQRGDLNRLGEFLEYWLSIFGEVPVSSKEAAERLSWDAKSPLGELLDSPPLQENGTVLARLVLKKHHMRVVGGLRIQQSKTRGNLGWLWFVERVGSSSSSPSSPTSPTSPQSPQGPS